MTGRSVGTRKGTCPVCGKEMTLIYENSDINKQLVIPGHTDFENWKLGQTIEPCPGSGQPPK